MVINKKLAIEGISLLVLALFMINFVSAYAVSSAYYEENPMKISPGSTIGFKMILQNLASEEDVTVKARINSGTEIISLADASDVYVISGGDKKEVNLRAIVPADASIGQTYHFDIVFTTVAGAEGGTLNIGSSIGKGFDVVVVEESLEQVPESQSSEKSTLIYWIILVLIILLVLWLVKKKRK